MSNLVKGSSTPSLRISQRNLWRKVEESHTLKGYLAPTNHSVPLLGVQVPLGYQTLFVAKDGTFLIRLSFSTGDPVLHD